MGRYYNGDIEGKFWFGVQPSSDADFFGEEGEARELEYYFDKDNIPDIKKGITECEHELDECIQGGVAVLDKFFDKNDMYKDEDIAKLIEKANGWDTDRPKTPKVNNVSVKHALEWYARLRLGKQILNCVERHDHCHFSAEL